MHSSKFAHAASRTALVFCALLFFVAGSARQLPQERQPAPENQAHPPATPFVMIDPGHGGDDNGAALLGDKLVEKDVTLALARRLKAELQEKGIVARLLRDADVALSLEQRAEAANEQHAALYVALHAGMPGRGIRVYSPANVSSGVTSGRFLPWDNAQSNYLSHSQALAAAVAAALAKKNLTVSTLSTPLRPLNNINAPAIAVELATDPADLQDIVGQKFQTSVASGIAAEIAQQRSQWEKQP